MQLNRVICGGNSLGIIPVPCFIAIKSGIGCRSALSLGKASAALGIDREVGRPSLVPRPQIINGPLKDHARLTLEFYVFFAVPIPLLSLIELSLTASTGVQLALRPVLPMAMRGVPATRAKGIYIFMDAAREAREAGVDFGHFYDPIGDPTDVVTPLSVGL